MGLGYCWISFLMVLRFLDWKVSQLCWAWFRWFWPILQLNRDNSKWPTFQLLSHRRLINVISKVWLGFLRILTRKSMSWSHSGKWPAQQHYKFHCGPQNATQNSVSALKAHHWPLFYLNSIVASLSRIVLTWRLYEGMGSWVDVQAYIWVYLIEEMVLQFNVRPKHLGTDFERGRETFPSKAVLLPERDHCPQVQLLHWKCIGCCDCTRLWFRLYRQHKGLNRQDIEIGHLPSFGQIEGKIKK